MRSSSLPLAAMIVATVAGVSVSAADLQVVTPDGHLVILHDDRTWEFADDAMKGTPLPASSEASLDSVFEDAKAPADAPVTVPETPAVLEVTQRKPGRASCTYGLKLTNHLPTMIRNIVPQFYAYTGSDVMYQRVFQAWTNLRPTRDFYKEISFDGISCDEIAYIKVGGAARCEIGDLNRFSSTSKDCLAQITVPASSLVEISVDSELELGQE